MHDVMHSILHASPILIYFGVAGILLLESSGVPLVNNTLLLLMGALASMGHLNIGILALVSIGGSVAGACLAYSIGARGGRLILLRLASFFHIDTQKIDMMDLWFHKSGTWMIFFSRLTPYVRPFACFPAGISRMNFTRFSIAASAGSVLWCTAMLSLGWMLGHRWKLALSLMQQYTVPTICFLLGLVIVYLLLMRIMKRFLNTKYRSQSPRRLIEQEV